MTKETLSQLYNGDSELPLQPQLPFLTADLPGIGGDIKTIPSDFVVEEIPLYECSGDGTHVFFCVQKKSITTTETISRLAQALGVRRFDIGYAGRKDANAITRQWFSIEHIDPEQIKQLKLNKITILEVARHNNKLKVGHLKGNRFTIRLRNLQWPLDEAMTLAMQTIEILCRRGVPNYFGPQRFGYRYDSHLLGEALVKNDTQRFFNVLLGYPESEIQEEFILPRTLYRQGDLEAAFEAWHPAFRDHRDALKALIRSKGKPNKALRTIDRRLLSLFVSAWQSDLFNAVLAKRIGQIDTVLEGDMAYKHDNGACFRVENPEVEQPRCTAFQISPTGPLLGARMMELTGTPGAIENPILQAQGLAPEDYIRIKRYGGTGGRRPLRFLPLGVTLKANSDNHGQYLQLSFELPSGCYATVLLRELTKKN